MPVDPDWRARAACRDADPDLFFTPDHHATPRARADRIAAALAICAGCPVRRACLEDAIASGDGFAIRGGTTPEQRGYRSKTGTRLGKRHLAQGAA